MHFDYQYTPPKHSVHKVTSTKEKRLIDTRYIAFTMKKRDAVLLDPRWTTWCCPVRRVVPLLLFRLCYPIRSTIAPSHPKIQNTQKPTQPKHIHDGFECGIPAHTKKRHSPAQTQRASGRRKRETSRKTKWVFPSFATSFGVDCSCAPRNFVPLPVGKETLLRNDHLRTAYFRNIALKFHSFVRKHELMSGKLQRFKRCKDLAYATATGNLKNPRALCVEKTWENSALNRCARLAAGRDECIAHVGLKRKWSDNNFLVIPWHSPSSKPLPIDKRLSGTAEASFRYSPLRNRHTYCGCERRNSNLNAYGPQSSDKRGHHRL